MQAARKTTVAILTAGVLFSGSIWASPVTSQDARTTVDGWLSLQQPHQQTRLSKPAMGAATTVNDTSGNALCHVVQLDPEGFVIVATDDRLEPIICFSPAGRFVASPQNPLYALVSQDLPRRLSHAKKAAAGAEHAARPGARKKWAALQQAALPAAAAQPDAPGALNAAGLSDVRVAPLIQTRWDQNAVANTNACYNYYTPPYSEGNSSNYPSGCIATALSQLLRYWRYPVAGVGTNARTIYVNDVAQSRRLRGGDGAGGPYDWENMVTNPASNCTLAQRQAIGALCADAGTAVGMSYHYASSYTAAWLQQYALTTVFGYSNAVCSQSVGPSGTLDASAIVGIINPNLDAGCPVLLGVAGDLYAHAIVCDGYGYNLSTLYHHLNMGWGGFDDAWYALPLIDPAGLSYTFNLIQTIIYNAWTNQTGEIVSGRVLTAGGMPIPDALVTATRAGGGTYTTTSDARGIYALAGIPSSSSYTMSTVKAGCIFTGQVFTTGWSTNFSFASGNLWGVDLVSTEPGVTMDVSGTPLNRTNGAAVVTVTLSKPCALPVTVTLALSGTAAVEADYTVSATNLTILPGNLTATATLTPLPNPLTCGHTTIVVDLDNVVNASELGVQQVVVQIVDDLAPPDSPSNFRALAANSSMIRVSWKPNASNDTVLVAWNSSPNFGTPVAAYATNDWISGGGTILYAGSATTVTHTCLASSTSYFYQAWSVNSKGVCSTGLFCSATTSNRTTLPFTYGFEDPDHFFATWPQEVMIGNTAWCVAGSLGTRSAALYIPGVKTRLLTPRLDFGTDARNAQLSFRHRMPASATNQDTLCVYYKTNASESGTLLMAYTNAIASWTVQTIPLPNPNNSYTVVFEGYAKGGGGISLDDVSIVAHIPTATSFTVWTQLHTPGNPITNAFAVDRDGDGVPNGIEYAFGTNWAAGTPLLNIRIVAGVPVVEVPCLDAQAGPYAGACVEVAHDLAAPHWTNRVHAVGGSDKPSNRDWFQPDVDGSNSFFRLRAVLLE